MVWKDWQCGVWQEQCMLSWTLKYFFYYLLYSSSSHILCFSQQQASWGCRGSFRAWVPRVMLCCGWHPNLNAVRASVPKQRLHCHPRGCFKWPLYNCVTDCPAGSRDRLFTTSASRSDHTAHLFLFCQSQRRRFMALTWGVSCRRQDKFSH